MHNTVANVLQTVFESKDAAILQLQITSEEYDRMVSHTYQPFLVKMWILRQLMDEYNISPMYIFGINNKMFMTPQAQTSK